MLREHAALSQARFFWLTGCAPVLMSREQGAGDADTARFGVGMDCVLALGVGLCFGAYGTVEQCPKLAAI